MFNFSMNFGGGPGFGGGQQSNYPSNYPSYGGYNSGPPPPPGGGYGAFGQSAYNNHTSYGGQGGFGGFGGQMGGGFPALQQMHGSYPMGQCPPPPPPQPPSSYNMHGYQQQAMDGYEQQMQRQMYQQMGFRAPTAPQAQGGGGEEPEEQPEEEQEDKRDIDEEVKERMKMIFIDELSRRYAVSSTFEMAQGTVVPMMKYPEDDIVVAFYKAERDEDLTGKDWDPEADCEYLREAMKGLGTDESIITTIVGTRCNAQRQRLKEMFKTMYGRDLIEDIKSELSGDYKGAILACFVSPAEFDARCIKRAIYGAGTDEQALIEILMTRTNAQIKEMRSIYGQVARPDEVTYETLIEKDIEDDCSGDFNRLLIAASQGNRYEISREKLEESVEEVTNANGDGTGMYRIDYTKLCDIGKAKRDAKRLFEAGEDRWGTDEETFNLIFSTRDFYQLRAVYEQYVKITQANIINAIDEETSGSFKKGLAAIAMSVMNRPKYFAKKLVKSMKGLGTDEETLIRIIASRSEIDMMQIKAEFLDMTNKTLWRWIKEDTSFNFKNILQALVGRD